MERRQPDTVKLKCHERCVTGSLLPLVDTGNKTNSQYNICFSICWCYRAGWWRFRPNVEQKCLSTGHTGARRNDVSDRMKSETPTPCDRDAARWTVKKKQIKSQFVQQHQIQQQVREQPLTRDGRASTLQLWGMKQTSGAEMNMDHISLSLQVFSFSHAWIYFL